MKRERREREERERELEGVSREEASETEGAKSIDLGQRLPVSPHLLSQPGQLHADVVIDFIDLCRREPLELRGELLRRRDLVVR